MSDKNIDKARGRAKEAAGVLGGSKRLKSEGRAEQAKGAAKDSADKLVDALAGGKKN
jgi:uncharacterized protein YjbJ (UPF0337 family)